MSDRMREIDCQGRFDESRALVEVSLELALEEHESKKVTRDVLQSAFEHIETEIYAHDVIDPYFKVEEGMLRKQIDVNNVDASVILPLIDRNQSVDPDLYRAYARTQGATGSIEDVLSEWHQGINLTKKFDIDPLTSIGIAKECGSNGKGEHITLSSQRANLKGYTLVSKFGIGPKKEELVVPDTPYSIELYDTKNDLALQIGFWYKQDEHGSSMVIGQIQQPRDSKLPGGEKAQMGIVGLEIARVVAEQMGIDRLETYSAKRHPMFRQYPERKGRMMKDFKCYFDSSAKALGFDGSRTTSYMKPLSQ